MPTYDYICTSKECNSEFELFLSIKSKPMQKCPTCGCKAKRQIGAGGGIIFRGSGFYITDYRSKEYSEKASAEKESSEKESSSESKSSESSSSDSSSSDSSSSSESSSKSSDKKASKNSPKE